MLFQAIDRSKAMTLTNNTGAPEAGSHRPATPPHSPFRLDADDAVDAPAVREVLQQSVFFDGVFKGSYSLAIVNRCLAEALIRAGVKLVCHTAEADYQTDPALCAVPAVRARMLEAYPAKGSFDIHLRNSWPPATRDMVGRFNAFVCFAWEEADLPPHLVDRFNRDLDLIMVTSHFVADAFRHSGVDVPIEVVGNGCDHVLAVEPVFSVAAAPEGYARILHVSSGFARKGADTLIAAFCEAFGRDDRVELVLKTFANPNNVIPATVQRLGDRSELASIRVIEADQTYEELVGLLGTATMIVAPSRGEGFGLPLAEAMMLGVPVVTTNYSGQLDFCRPDTAWLVDFTLSPSRAHVASAFGVWADASVDNLAEQMRNVLAQPEEASQRSERAKGLLAAHFTWESVADRVIRALACTTRPAARASAPRWSMDVVTSWQQRCGIATYAQHLYGTAVLSPHIRTVLGRRVLDDALPEAAATPMDPRLVRIWGYDLTSLMRLAKRLECGQADVLWMQHHPGHFSNPDMEILAGVVRHSSYRVRAITFHNVREAHGAGSLHWTLAFDIAFVHSAEDAAILSAAGHRRAVVVPHGFLPRGGTGDLPVPDPADFTVGSFGFLNPHKNVEGLLAAFAQARRFEPRLRLKIFNCVQKNDASRLTRSVIENLVCHFGLETSVASNFDFIAEETLIGELASCDLLAFPYGASNETATGAARIAMSADRPILCSRSTVLRDMWPFSHVLRSDDADCLSEALVSLAQNRELLALYDYERRRTLDWYSYPRVAQRCAFHIEKLLGETNDYSRAA